MAEKKIDRRVRYTKKAIRESFLDLLEIKPIEKISVTEICKNADINRGTFYSHYSDPYELKSSLEVELAEAFAEAAKNTAAGYLSSLEALELLKENKDLCRLFCGTNGDMDAFIEIIVDNSADYLLGVMQCNKDASDAHRDCVRAMLVAAVSALIKFWYENDMKDDPALIAECMDNFCIGGSKCVFEGFESSFT